MSKYSQDDIERLLDKDEERLCELEKYKAEVIKLKEETDYFRTKISQLNKGLIITDIVLVCGLILLIFK